MCTSSTSLQFLMKITLYLRPRNDLQFKKRSFRKKKEEEPEMSSSQIPSRPDRIEQQSKKQRATIRSEITEINDHRRRHKRRGASATKIKKTPSILGFQPEEAILDPALKRSPTPWQNSPRTRPIQESSEPAQFEKRTKKRWLSRRKIPNSSSEETLDRSIGEGSEEN